MESRITSNFTEMPASCKKAEEQMKQILEEEDTQFKVAELPDGCEEKIQEFENSLKKMGVNDVALVAYQKAW